MKYLTKQLRKDWNQIQSGCDGAPKTPKGRWKAFCRLAAKVYSIKPKQVKNFVHNQ